MIYFCSNNFHIQRESIIQEMFLSKDVDAAIRKMEPVDLHDDLKQEVFLVLCEMDTDRLIRMYEDGVLKYFIVRTILNMAKSNTSQFYYKFRRQLFELSSIQEIIEDRYDEDLYLRLDNGLGVLHWYEKEIFRLYSDNGQNVLQLSRETKIPYRSLIKTITKVKQLLKYKIRNYEFD